MKSLLAGLFLVSCATAKAATIDICPTRCGMETETTALKCKEFQRFEAIAVEVFRHAVKGWRKAQICKALAGWRVEVHQKTLKDSVCPYSSWDARNFGEPTPFCVLGLAHEKTMILEVDSDDWLNSSLAHEMVHAIDIKKYEGHCSWVRRGIPEALRVITGIADTGINPRDNCEEEPK